MSIEACNVTQREGAAEALASTLAADEILEGIAEGFVWLDADWRLLQVNSAAERILGQSRAELVGRNYWEVFPQLSGTSLERDLRRALAEAASIEFEHERDGRRFHSRARAARAGGLHLYLREITASRRVEEELQFTAHRLTVALRHSPIVVFTQDAALRYTWIWSPQTSFCSGGLGRTDREIHPAGDGERFCEVKRALLATGQNERHEFAFPVDGVVRIYDITLEPLRRADGSVIGITGAAIDITESKSVEQDLRETNIRMRLALDAGQMATWDWDLRSGRTTWSDRHYRMLGLDPASTAPSYQTWLERVHPEDRPKAERAISRARSGKRLFHLEYRVVWPDGSIHWLEGRGQFLHSPDGKPVRMTGVLSDITERKRTEEALLHKLKLESIGLLAGGIAHDFNNLLAGILGAASYALDQLPPSHDLLPMLRLVVQSSERAALLTRQLLAYSGRGRFLIERVQLDRLARETAELVCTSFPKTVRCTHITEPGLPAVDADPGQMQQLVMNLLINAAESIREGSSGTITVRTASEQVDEERARTEFGEYEISPGIYVVLEVSDNGCGMDAGILARIFDPFFTTKFTGRGLGLAAVQGIVRGHHGGMLVETKVGEGSRFRIFLPAAESVGASPDPPPSGEKTGNVESEPTAGSRGTILVVDDEAMVRRVARAALERGGFRILEAADGEEALRLFAAHADEISLVLLDMDMPGMSGIEVARALRKRSLAAPVLVSSGFSEVEVANRFHGIPIGGVIEKPFRANQLVERVQEALS